MRQALQTSLLRGKTITSITSESERLTSKEIVSVHKAGAVSFINGRVGAVLPEHAVSNKQLPATVVYCRDIIHLLSVVVVVTAADKSGILGCQITGLACVGIVVGKECIA